MGQMIQKALYGFVAVSVLSIFLPLVSVQAPVIGPVSFSAFGIVAKVLPSPSGASKQEGKKSKFSLGTDKLKSLGGDKMKAGVDDIKGIMQNVIGDLNARSANPKYWLVVICMVAGAVAHVLIPVIVFAALLRRTGFAGRTAVLSCILAVVFMGGLLLANSLLQMNLDEAVGAVKDKPIAGLTALLGKTMAQGFAIRAGAGLYTLIAATFLIFVSGLAAKQSK